MSASVFSDPEFGASLLTEDAYYTALRPNGVLRAKSFLKVEIDNNSSENWSKLKTSKTSAGFSLGLGGIFGSASGSRVLENRESEFLSADFTISFEIVQGLIDRHWLPMEFLESRAYTDCGSANGYGVGSGTADHVAIRWQRPSAGGRDAPAAYDRVLHPKSRGSLGRLSETHRR